MSKVINNVKAEDCPVVAKLREYSMIIYNLDGSITLIPKQKSRSLDARKIYTCNVKTGILSDYYDDRLLFINHPKYGVIQDPCYTSIEHCFERWNVDKDDEPITFKTADDLLSLDRHILVNFMKKIIDWVDDNNEGGERLLNAWVNCFGSYFGKPRVTTLYYMEKEELVYLIISCENFTVVNCAFSFWELNVHGIFKNIQKST